MEHHISLFCTLDFLENMALEASACVLHGDLQNSGCYWLCTVIVVLTLTVPVNNLIYNHLLVKAHWLTIPLK
jgi:Na+-transporting NADH:ubiquinone oxidoreductase subunit NqrE